MKRVSRIKPRRQRGTSLTELIVAAGVAVAMLAGVAQLAHQATRQYRLAADRNLVAWEATNAMEDLMSRRWEELSPEAPPMIDVSPACRAALRDVRLKVEIVGEENDPGARRLTVIVDWQAGQTTQPYQLVAWRHRQEQGEGEREGQSP